MCPLDDKKRNSFKVVLSSADALAGTADAYTVMFPRIDRGTYRVTVRILTKAVTTTEAYQLNIRGPGFTSLNKTSGQSYGYATALVYSDLLAAEGVVYLDVTSGAPDSVDIQHLTQSTGAPTTGMSRHVIALECEPI